MARFIFYAPVTFKVNGMELYFLLKKILEIFRKSEERGNRIIVLGCKCFVSTSYSVLFSCILGPCTFYISYLPFLRKYNKKVYKPNN